MRKKVLFGCILTFFAFSEIRPQEKLIPDPVILSMCSEINKDTVKSYIKQLQNFGTRYYSMSNRRNIAEWIRTQFVRMGYSNACLDSFTMSGNWQYNVIATLTGSTKPDSVYILGAHHDCTSDDPTVYAPGADDNASGVSAVLEVARVFKKRHYAPAGTIRFITFAAEETGLDGSNNYATKAKNANMRIQMMINNDMISYCADSASDWKIRLVYYPNSASVTSLASQMTTTYTSLGVWENNADVQYSDSWSFYEPHRYKTIFLEEKTNTPYYHKQLDRIQFCNIPYTAEMIKVSCAMLMNENGTAVVEVADNDDRIKDFVLFQNYPNPFNPSTVLRYNLPSKSHVTLKIYNALSQEVRTVYAGVQDRGEHQVEWDGRDNTGRNVSSGIYIYRLQAGSHTRSMKMTLLR